MCRSRLKNIHCRLPSDPCTLTDPSSSSPRSLLKTTPPPPGCPWVPGGPEATPEPSFRGLVLDHQVLKQPEAKNLSKTAKFDQKQQFSSVFLLWLLKNLMVEHQTPKTWFWGYPRTPRYPWAPRGRWSSF